MYVIMTASDSPDRAGVRWFDIPEIPTLTLDFSTKHFQRFPKNWDEGGR